VAREGFASVGRMSDEVEEKGLVKMTDGDKADQVNAIVLKYEKGEAADSENRRLHTEDLTFLYDTENFGQWDPFVISLRQGRPSYTFNRCLQPVNMILGDQRQTAPAIKVRPIKGGSQPVADIFGGLWRSIEQDSRAEEIYGECYKHSVAGGFGEMMLMPEWEADNSFDQVLRLKWIPNPLTVVRDPESTDPCGGDAQWAMEGGRISTDKFEADYPDMIASTFSMSRDSLGWYSDGQIRVVNFFERFAIKKEIALLSDGRVIDYTRKEKAVEEHLARTKSDAATVVRTRMVNSYKIRYTKCDGTHILKGPIDYDWKRVPIVRMPGRYVNIEGKQKLQSAIRHSKDAQRAYNFQSSDAIERSALVPKARYFVTPQMIKGFEDLWNSSNTAPRIYMPYNVDKDAPNGGQPFREQPIDVPQGAIAMAQKAAQDIQATTGYFDPALGNADDMNRVSGKALVTHTRRSDLGSHEFISNFGLALKLLAMMAIDMIPSVYDTERVVRIIGVDGVDKLVTVNGQTDDGQLMNDLKLGSYDCDITLGPSYQTARQESLATLLDAAGSVPGLAEIIPDLITKAIDTPDSDEMTKRLRKMLIQKGIVQPTPEEQQAMGPAPPPNPVQQAAMGQKIAEFHEQAAKASLAIDKANNSPLEIHKLVAETVKTQLANILAAQEVTKTHPEAFASHMETQLLNGTAPAAPVQQ
jgi:hypothetical protein